MCAGTGTAPAAALGSRSDLSLPELIVGGGPHSSLKPGAFTWHQHPTEATAQYLVQR